MSPRSAGVLCLLAVLLCCCIHGSAGAQKKSKEQLLSQVDSVVKNLKTMNSKRGLGEEHVSRSSLGKLYMTELEVQRALLADPNDLDLQEGMKELKSLEKDLTGRGGASIPQIRNKADVPGALAKIIKEREQQSAKIIKERKQQAGVQKPEKEREQLFSEDQANQIVR